MNKEQLVTALNEWMRRYIETPEEFNREWQTVNEFLKAEKSGLVPTYGELSAAYLLKLLAEQGE